MIEAFQDKRTGVSDFQSLDSFWLNTFQRGIDKLYYSDSRQQAILDSFLRYASEYLRKLGIISKPGQEDGIEQVNTYFRDDVFQGK